MLDGPHGNPLPANDVPPQLFGTFEWMLEDMPPQPVLHFVSDLPVAARPPLEAR